MITVMNLDEELGMPLMVLQILDMTCQDKIQ